MRRIVGRLEANEPERPVRYGEDEGIAGAHRLDRPRDEILSLIDPAGPREGVALAVQPPRQGFRVAPRSAHCDLGLCLNQFSPEVALDCVQMPEEVVAEQPGPIADVVEDLDRLAKIDLGLVEPTGEVLAIAGVCPDHRAHIGPRARFRHLLARRT